MRAHSADVQMDLIIDGSTLPIAQLGPTFLILRTRVDHGPCRAEIVMTIDGRATRWAVYLPEGMQANVPETAIAADRGQP